MTVLELFKALADETRLLSALLILQEGELCVCELMAALNTSQPKVSRHLAQLRKLGILADRRQGQWVFYRIDPECESWVSLMLRQAAKVAEMQLAVPMQRLKQMQSRPERARACCPEE